VKGSDSRPILIKGLPILPSLLSLLLLVFLKLVKRMNSEYEWPIRPSRNLNSDPSVFEYLPNVLSHRV
jgi:hypothetical protein